MQLELKPIAGAFHIVDVSVPGWRTVEQHGSEEVAKARFKALTGAGSVVEGRGATPATIAGEVASEGEGDDPLLLAVLSGPAGDVRRRIESAGAEALVELRRLEILGAGRKTVIRAIDKRLG